MNMIQNWRWLAATGLTIASVAYAATGRAYPTLYVYQSLSNSSCNEDEANNCATLLSTANAYDSNGDQTCDVQTAGSTTYTLCNTASVKLGVTVGNLDCDGSQTVPFGSGSPPTSSCTYTMQGTCQSGCNGATATGSAWGFTN